VRNGTALPYDGDVASSHRPALPDSARNSASNRDLPPPGSPRDPDDPAAACKRLVGELAQSSQLAAPSDELRRPAPKLVSRVPGADEPQSARRHPERVGGGRERKVPIEMRRRALADRDLAGAGVLDKLVEIAQERLVSRRVELPPVAHAEKCDVGDVHGQADHEIRLVHLALPRHGLPDGQCGVRRPAWRVLHRLQPEDARAGVEGKLVDAGSERAKPLHHSSQHAMTHRNRLVRSLA
jgi:hypothetical protein